jgi:D-sedoheptulose 7-phosphate isomerase
MSSISFSIDNYLSSHINLFKRLDVIEIENSVNAIKQKFLAGKKIITCGNGGSASTASHYITDWNKMVNLATGKKFRGISLCDNIGLVTAFANDLTYDDVFSGQLDAIMDEGDLLVAISGSGNSSNVIKAVNKAKELGGQVLGVVGYDGGLLKPMCDYSVWVQSLDMQLCEDVHLMFGHMVMKTLCGSEIKN